MGPCRTHNENIRLHTERTPCRVEDQWSGLMKGGWCGWWLERKRDGEWGRELWCWLSNTLCTVPNPLTHREVTQIYTEKRKAISVVAFTYEPVLSGSVFLLIYLILIFHFFLFWVYLTILCIDYQLLSTVSYSSSHAPTLHWRKVCPNCWRKISFSAASIKANALINTVWVKFAFRLFIFINSLSKFKLHYTMEFDWRKKNSNESKRKSFLVTYS